MEYSSILRLKYPDIMLDIDGRSSSVSVGVGTVVVDGFDWSVVTIRGGGGGSGTGGVGRLSGPVLRVLEQRVVAAVPRVVRIGVW
jgi:hypothetical protein